MRVCVVLACALVVLCACNHPLSGPGPVQLLAPANGSNLTRSEVSFMWRDLAEAASYNLQVAADDDFDRVITDDTTERTEVTVSLVTDGEYWWRVRARDARGAWGGWSEVWDVNLVRFKIVASHKTQGYAQDIWVADGRAYVADGQAGLSVFDVTSPQQPRLLGSIMDSLNEAWGVMVNGDYAHLAYGYKELMTVNVSRPESLKKVGELEYPQPGFGYDIACQDSMVYIAADAQFLVVNVRDPRYPNLVFQSRYPRGLRGICLSGNYCYLALEQLGVAVWDISAIPPTQVGSFDTPSNARGVAVQNNHLYVADGRNGLIVADVTHPPEPRIVASLSLAGYANRISVADSLVYVGCSDAGLAVVNVKDPTAPVLAAQVSTNYTRGAEEYQGFVFCCDRDSGLVVIRKEE